jgi:hypothetical protein
LIELCRQVPGQQFINAIDRIIGDMGEQVTQIALRVDAVELGGSCRAPDYAEPSRLAPVFPDLRLIHSA